MSDVSPLDSKRVTVIRLQENERLFRLYPKVLRVGVQENIEYIPERRIEDLQFCFHFQGTDAAYEVEIDGKMHRAPFPNLLIKRPGEMHRITSSGKLLQSFHFAYSADIFLLDLLPKQVQLVSLEFDQRLRSRMDAVRELLGRSAESGVCDEIDSQCYGLVLLVLLAWKRCDGPPSYVAERIQKVASYLQNHYDSNPNLAQVARRFSLSLRSLQRQWSQCHDQSPGKYLLQLRMDEARRLLRETHLTVAAISERLNFSRPEAFVRSFQRETGMSPTLFRNT